MPDRTNQSYIIKGGFEGKSLQFTIYANYRADLCGMVPGKVSNTERGFKGKPQRSSMSSSAIHEPSPCYLPTTALYTNQGQAARPPVSDLSQKKMGSPTVTLSYSGLTEYRELAVPSPRGALQVSSPRATLEVLSPRAALEVSSARAGLEMSPRAMQTATSSNPVTETGGGWARRHKGDDLFLT